MNPFEDAIKAATDEYLRLSREFLPLNAKAMGAAMRFARREREGAPRDELDELRRDRDEKIRASEEASAACSRASDALSDLRAKAREARFGFEWSLVSEDRWETTIVDAGTPKAVSLFRDPDSGAWSWSIDGRSSRVLRPDFRVARLDAEQAALRIY